jgi:hypothetical protein
MSMMQDPNIPFFVSRNLTFFRNQIYRVRILNGKLNSQFNFLSFVTECNE